MMGADDEFGEHPPEEWSDRRKIAFWVIVLLALVVISGGHPVEWIIAQFSTAGCAAGCR